MATLFDPLYATIPPPSSIGKAQVSHVLDALHQIAFQRAIKKVLQTEITEATFPQIIDALPLKSVARDTRGIFWESAINHDNLCAGALEKATTL